VLTIDRPKLILTFLCRRRFWLPASTGTSTSIDKKHRTSEHDLLAGSSSSAVQDRRECFIELAG
jgi:hypothetical protein